MVARVSTSKYRSPRLAIASGLAFLTTILVLALAFPRPSSFQYFVFRTILGIALAGFASSLPGFLNISLGRTVRAGGALGVFAASYFLNPARLIRNETAADETALLEIDDVRLVDDTDALCRLDFVVRNPTSEPLNLTGVRLRFNGKLVPLAQGYQEPTFEYKVQANAQPLTEAGSHEVTFDVRQGWLAVALETLRQYVPARGSDRFQINLRFGPLGFGLGAPITSLTVQPRYNGKDGREHRFTISPSYLGITKVSQ